MPLEAKWHRAIRYNSVHTKSNAQRGFRYYPLPNGCH